MDKSWRHRGRLLLPCVFLLALLLPGLSAAACPKAPRSGKVVREFRKTHPCPATGLTKGPCKNFVIDHRYPLCAGGTDTVANMAWQEVQAARDKDRLEREVCRLQPRPCRHRGD